MSHRRAERGRRFAPPPSRPANAGRATSPVSLRCKGEERETAEVADRDPPRLALQFITPPTPPSKLIEVVVPWELCSR
jgi:hypothetical protein